MSGRPLEKATSEDAIASLRDVEERSVKGVESANASKAERIRKAREKSDEMLLKAKGEAEALKVRMLATSRAAIDKEEKEVAAAGERQASDARKKRAPDALPAELCRRVLEGYRA